MKGQLLGKIPCPYCDQQMTCKTDKNGKPFGHCGFCQGQLRVGGNEAREVKFSIKYPLIKAALAGIYGASETAKPVIEVEVIATPAASSVTGVNSSEKPVTDTGKKTNEFTMEL